MWGSVPLEHPRQAGHDDGGQQPAGEREPERRPRRPAAANERVSLLEVHYRQQQIRRVAERVELGLLATSFSWVQQVRILVSNVEEPPTEEEQPAHVDQSKGRTVAVTDRPAQHCTP